MLRSLRRAWQSKRRLKRWLTRGLVVGGAASILGPLLAVLLLRVVDPPTTAVILARTIQRWREGKVPAYPKRQVVPLARVNGELRRAVLAAEDDAFYQHSGFDLTQIEKALADEPGRRKVRGASTISQQTAKNLFLWNGRSFVRKGLEAYLTVWLELLLPKDRILEIYLSLVECGDGYFGVEACAQHHFKQSAAALAGEDAALLAAVLPSPRKINPFGDYARERAQVILERMEIPVLRGP